MDAEQIARGILDTVDGHFQMFGTARLITVEAIAAALRTTYAEGYAAAREQAEQLAIRFGHAGLVGEIRAMESPK